MSEFTQAELLEHVDDVLAGLWTDDLRERALTTSTADAGVLDQLSELGWFGLCAPEEDGGLGLDPASMVSVFQRFGQHLVVGPLFEYMVVPAVLLRRSTGGSTAAGSLAGVLRSAMTLDVRLALVDASASLSADVPLGSVDASEEHLQGGVALVRGGADASHLVVRAERDGTPILALIPRERPGVRVEPRPSADPGVGFVTVTLEAVSFGAEDVLLEGSDARAAWNDLAAWSRVCLAGELTGIARHLHDLSVDYIKQRKQFGRAIGSFQALQHLAAENARRVVMLENLCAATADDALVAPDECRWRAAAILKGLVSEQARLVCEDTMQMHGGIGFTQEYELQWYYKRALALQNWYGNERELAQLIGRARLTAGTA